MAFSICDLSERLFKIYTVLVNFVCINQFFSTSNKISLIYQVKMTK